ncbi:hypothetical protein [Streptomyces kronopolitis]
MAEVYAQKYDHTLWADHVERVQKTIEVVDEFAQISESRTIADLSCGDGAIVRGSRHNWRQTYLGDLTTTGPIETALLNQAHVGMFLLSETLEHVEDPDRLLSAIRAVAENLVLTTPFAEADDGNPEHYWGWDDLDLDQMLDEAGWGEREVELFTPESVSYYTFQIWRCS